MLGLMFYLWSDFFHIGIKFVKFYSMEFILKVVSVDHFAIDFLLLSGFVSENSKLSFALYIQYIF